MESTLAGVSRPDRSLRRGWASEREGLEEGWGESTPSTEVSRQWRSERDNTRRREPKGELDPRTLGS